MAETSVPPKPPRTKTPPAPRVEQRSGLHRARADRHDDDVCASHDDPPAPRAGAAARVGRNKERTMAREKSRRPTKKQTVKKRPAKKTPRLTRVTGGDRAVP